MLFFKMYKKLFSTSFVPLKRTRSGNNTFRPAVSQTRRISTALHIGESFPRCFYEIAYADKTVQLFMRQYNKLECEGKTIVFLRMT